MHNDSINATNGHIILDANTCIKGLSETLIQEHVNGIIDDHINYPI